MKRLLLAPFLLGLITPVQVEAHPISLEERAVDLVIAKYDKQLKKRLEGKRLSWLNRLKTNC